MRRNEVNCRKALLSAGIGSGVPGRTHCSLKVTVPKEFSLSAPATPKGRLRGREADGSAASSRESSVRSERGVASRATQARRVTATPLSKGTVTPRPPGLGERQPLSQKWSPQLNVPIGPRLATEQRSKRRQSLSCPPDRVEEAAAFLSAAPAGARQAVRQVVGGRAATPERRRRPLAGAAAAWQPQEPPVAGAADVSDLERAQHAALKESAPLKEQHQRDKAGYTSLFRRRPANATGAGDKAAQGRGFAAPSGSAGLGAGRVAGTPRAGAAPSSTAERLGRPR